MTSGKLNPHQWIREVVLFLQQNQKQSFLFRDLPEDLQDRSNLYWCNNRGYIKGERIHEGGRSVKLWKPTDFVAKKYGGDS